MSTENNTLVVLTPGFAADEDDSNCLPFPLAFVRNLKREFPALHIVVLAFEYPFFAATYPWFDVDVQSFAGRSRGGFARWRMWMRVLGSIARIKKNGNIIGLLSFWLGEAALVGRIAAKRHGLRHFTWLLGQDARRGNRYIRFIRPLPEHLIVLSDFLAAELSANYRLQVSNIIAPGIDQTEFDNATYPREIDILAAGSLIPLKRFEQVITLVQALNERGLHLRVLICGDGPDKQSLAKSIRDGGLSGQVILCGELPHAELLRLMQRARVLVHPSSYEGFSTVCNEALFAGAHVVSFIKPMNRSFDHWHTVSTEASLYDCVYALLTDDALTHERVLTSAISETCARIHSLFV